MSWEAFRWTAKSPSELYQVLGPHGVDELVRQARDVIWRELPPDDRSLAAATRAARAALDRNMTAWAKVKKPTPQAFFADLQPLEADRFIRQAMILCWMMMPRAGGREVADVRRIVTGIFDRNMAAWEQDERTFTGKAAAAKKTSKAPKALQKGSRKMKTTSKSPEENGKTKVSAAKPAVVGHSSSKAAAKAKPAEVAELRATFRSRLDAASSKKVKH